MAYNVSHRKVTISGALWGGVERWSIGFRVATPATQPTQAEVNALEAPVRAWFTSTSTFIANVHNVDEIKLAPIGTDGKYPVGMDSVVCVPATAINGGGSGGSTWPQNAFVVSLTTNVPRGRAHIGRIYLPPLRATLVPSGGIMATADVDSILAQTKIMLNAFIALSGVGHALVMSNIGAGDNNQVTGLRGGLVMDTQRRRRRSIAEAYRTLAL